MYKGMEGTRAWKVQGHGRHKGMEGTRAWKARGHERYEGCISSFYKVEVK